MKTEMQTIRDELASEGFERRGRKRDWKWGVERLLREAQNTAHTCSGRGVWPAGFQSVMPDYIRDYFESYGLDKARIGSLPPTGRQLDNLDLVNAAMMTPDLSPEDRAILWAHAGGQRWKRIVSRMCIPERTLRRYRNIATATIAVSLVDVERAKNKRVA
jgi:hypothetical protein